MEINLGVQQGWQCPICKRVYSPTTMMCMYCGNTELKTTTGKMQLVNMPNIVDGMPNDIMVNYCERSRNNENDT